MTSPNAAEVTEPIVEFDSWAWGPGDVVVVTGTRCANRSQATLALAGRAARGAHSLQIGGHGISRSGNGWLSDVIHRLTIVSASLRFPALDPLTTPREAVRTVGGRAGDDSLEFAGVGDVAGHTIASLPPLQKAFVSTAVAHASPARACVLDIGLEGFTADEQDSIITLMHRLAQTDRVVITSSVIAPESTSGIAYEQIVGSG